MTDTLQPPLDRTFRSAEGDFRVGRVFTQTFSVLSRNLLPFCIVTVIAALPYFFLFGANPRTGGAAGAAGTLSAGRAVLAVFWFVLALLLNALSQAVILYAAFEDMRGRPVNMMESLRIGFGRILPVLGTAILVGLLTMLGGMALVIPAFIVMTMLFVAIPACVVERLGPGKSIGRSAALTKGYRWRVFGLWISFMIVLGIVQSVSVGIASSIGGMFASQLVLLLWNAIYIAFSATLAVVTYRDLRVAKEGVDTDQIAAVFD
jgi:hypothetical protein